MAGPSNFFFLGGISCLSQRCSWLICVTLLHSYELRFKLQETSVEDPSFRSLQDEGHEVYATWCQWASSSRFSKVSKTCFTLSLTGRWTTCPIQRVGWCVCLKSWRFAPVLWPLWMIPRSKEYIRYHCMLGYLVFRETHMLGGYVTICYLTCQESEFSEYLGLAMWKSAFTPNAQRNLWLWGWSRRLLWLNL